MRTVDFTTEAEAARQEINAWIEAQTQERIAEMIPPGMINELTRLLLVNAIYFKATWLYPFPESNTQDGPFTLLDGSQVTAPLMRTGGAARIDYAAGDGYQAALLPYRGVKVEPEIDMLVILPAAGQFEQVEARLTPEFLAQTRQAMAQHDVTLVMPKFDFESRLDLKALLSDLGMTAPFEAADFSGIAASGGLAISDALHQANITVDEKGTEAAAATAIAMAESMLEPAEMTLDRPFIFAILDCQTGTILFLGRVLNPAE
jgi:serpin B